MGLKGLGEANVPTTIRRSRLYLGCGLALGSGVPPHGAREGVLHPQLSLAHVLAAEVAAARVLVAAV